MATPTHSAIFCNTGEIKFKTETKASKTGVRNSITPFKISKVPATPNNTPLNTPPKKLATILNIGALMP